MEGRREGGWEGGREGEKREREYLIGEMINGESSLF